MIELLLLIIGIVGGIYISRPKPNPRRSKDVQKELDRVYDVRDARERLRQRSKH